MSERLRFTDLHPKPADMCAEVVAGLSRAQKQIPPKYFYDQRGSQLFDAITEVPEYYPTRTEIAILRHHGEEMAELVGRDALLIELGSGSSWKIRILLEALQPTVYVPVDISREHLLASAGALTQSVAHLEVHAVCADYSIPFDLPMNGSEKGKARVAFFPGSSIGNFEPAEARQLLKRIGKLVGPQGKLLIGVDLIKEHEVLNAAYNDERGVTADFNINLLRRIKQELGADFDLDAFQHCAFFNANESRIEMHLVSRVDQRVSLAGQGFFFRAGESIHTESSYKYSVDGFHALAANAGFEAVRVWTDPDRLFSVHCLRFAA